MVHIFFQTSLLLKEVIRNAENRNTFSDNNRNFITNSFIKNV